MSGCDHFIPGLAVNRTSGGSHALLALTYCFDRDPSCAGSSCEIQVGFASSLDNGSTWSDPQVLSDPMQLGWLAPTTQCVMVGDYISTSFLAGQRRVVNAFAIGFQPPAAGQFNEPMFSALEMVRGGPNQAAKSPTLSSASAPDIYTTF